MKYQAEKDLELNYGENRIHFDKDEVKNLNLPEGFELPEGLSEVKEEVKKEEKPKKETKSGKKSK